MNKLPYELQIDILLRAGYPSLLKYCQYSSYNICDDEYLWSELIKQDFPKLYDLKSKYSTFKNYYIETYDHLYDLVESMLNDLSPRIEGVSFNLNELAVSKILKLFISFSNQYDNITQKERNELLYEIGDIIDYTRTNNVKDVLYNYEFEIIDTYIGEILSYLQIKYYKKSSHSLNRKCSQCKSIRTAQGNHQGRGPGGTPYSYRNCFKCRNVEKI